jgi:xylulokinase
MNPTVIRAGKANLFLSDLFAQTFVNATGIPVELYNNDGSVGAALGAGIGSGIFSSPQEAFKQMQPLQLIEPNTDAFELVYQEWRSLLLKQLSLS